MRDYLQVVRAVEGYYPQALGGASGKDERLRSSLVRFINATFREIERVNRWRLGFKVVTQATTPNLATYTPAAGRWLHIHQVYWREATGRIRPLELLEQKEARWVYGDGPNAMPGEPRLYAVLGDSTIQLYPTPDGNGPDAGNYTLQFEYYAELPQIIETTGTTAGTTALTVPATAYLTDQGAIAANPTADRLSIRGAGAATGLASPNDKDDSVQPWTAFPGATTVTLTSAPPTNVTAGQTFLYSTNWLIDVWPKVPLFGMLREVANYLQSTTDYATWEARYQKELEDLMEWDQQSRHDREVLAAGVSGQREPQMKGRGDWGWPYGWSGQ